MHCKFNWITASFDGTQNGIFKVGLVPVETTTCVSLYVTGFPYEKGFVWVKFVRHHL